LFILACTLNCFWELPKQKASDQEHDVSAVIFNNMMQQKIYKKGH